MVDHNKDLPLPSSATAPLARTSGDKTLAEAITATYCLPNPVRTDCTSPASTETITLQAANAGQGLVLTQKQLQKVMNHVLRHPQRKWKVMEIQIGNQPPKSCLPDGDCDLTIHYCTKPSGCTI